MDSPISWTTIDDRATPHAVLSISRSARFNLTFYDDGKEIGRLTFDPEKNELTFTGEADQSAQVFFDAVLGQFRAFLDQRDSG